MKEILRFRPILKQTLWGGEKIIPFKGMDLALTNVGESWSETKGISARTFSNACSWMAYSLSPNIKTT